MTQAEAPAEHVATPAPSSAWTVWVRAHALLAIWLVVLAGWAWAQPGSIFMADMLWGFTLLTLVVKLVWAGVRRLARQPARLRPALVGIALCVLSFGALRWATHHWEDRFRRNGDALVAQVKAWRDTHGGQYPPSHQVLTGQARAPRLGAPHYFLHDERPSLMYRSAWSGFDSWHYDFETNRWEFFPD